MCIIVSATSGFEAPHFDIFCSERAISPIPDHPHTHDYPAPRQSHFLISFHALFSDARRNPAGLLWVDRPQWQRKDHPIKTILGELKPTQWC